MTQVSLLRAKCVVRCSNFNTVIEIIFIRFLFNCSVQTPPEVRLILFLNQIFNYMWIEAMFVNITLNTENCFAGAICLDTMWIIKRLSAIVFTQFVGAPALRIMYVAQTPL